MMDKRNVRTRKVGGTYANSTVAVSMMDKRNVRIYEFLIVSILSRVAVSMMDKRNVRRNGPAVNVPGLNRRGIDDG